MRSIVLLFFLFLAVLFSSNSYAQNNARDMQKEAAIWDQLRVVNPDLVEVFKQGTERMDANDYKTAISLFQKVVDGAPGVDHALRRLGTCLSLSGEVEHGVPLLEKAVELDRSSANLSTLAQFLAFPGQGQSVTREAQERALSLLHEANEKAPEADARDLFLTAEIASAVQNEKEFRQVARELMEKFPDFAASHYINAIRATWDERWTEAEDEIRRAEKLGLSPEIVKEFLDSGVHGRASVWRYAGYSLYLVAAWVAGLVLLFVLGKALSQFTLRSIEYKAGSKTDVSSRELQLRKTYRRLIDLAGWYYYISLPVVVFLLIAVAASVFYGFMLIGRIPLRLMLILAVVTLGTIYKMIQTLFTKVKAQDPGRCLTREEAPGLWALTEEVANDLGTRPVDEIRITIATEVAVYESGTRRDKAQDKARRILILGTAVLNDFRTQAFRAVLAHEYGHFTHRDTAGGDVALRVNNDMMKFAIAMAMAGHAVWWNLGFQFLRIYHFLFRRISHGASRLHEVLADRTAALKYGADAFEEGLTHVIRRSVQFPFAANREIALALNSGRSLHNLYGLSVDMEESVEQEIEKTLQRPTSEDDTHPSPADRFRLVRQVSNDDPVSDTSMVWDLFQSREAVTMEMTALIDKSIDRSAKPVS